MTFRNTLSTFIASFALAFMASPLMAHQAQADEQVDFVGGVSAYSDDALPAGAYGVFYAYDEVIWVCDMHSEGWWAVAELSVAGDPVPKYVIDSADPGCTSRNLSLTEGTSVYFRVCLRESTLSPSVKCSSHQRAIAGQPDSDGASPDVVSSGGAHSYTPYAPGTRGRGGYGVLYSHGEVLQACDTRADGHWVITYVVYSGHIKVVSDANGSRLGCSALYPPDIPENTPVDFKVCLSTEPGFPSHPSRCTAFERTKA